jgi:hypothetical protein
MLSIKRDGGGFIREKGEGGGKGKKEGESV